MSKTASSQLSSLSNYHRPSRMNAHQVQDYIDLLVSKAQSLGERYVARQLDWAAAELQRVEVQG